MVLQNLIESLGVDVAFIISILHPEQEIEVVCLNTMLVISFRDNAHDFSETSNVLNQCHLASQIHNTSYGNGLEEEHLIYSHQLGESVRVLHASRDE